MTPSQITTALSTYLSALKATLPSIKGIEELEAQLAAFTGTEEERKVLQASLQALLKQLESLYPEAGSDSKTAKQIALAATELKLVANAADLVIDPSQFDPAKASVYQFYKDALLENPAGPVALTASVMEFMTKGTNPWGAIKRYCAQHFDNPSIVWSFRREIIGNDLSSQFSHVDKPSINTALIPVYITDQLKKLGITKEVLLSTPEADLTEAQRELKKFISLLARLTRTSGLGLADLSKTLIDTSRQTELESTLDTATVGTGGGSGAGLGAAIAGIGSWFYKTFCEKPATASAATTAGHTDAAASAGSDKPTAGTAVAGAGAPPSPSAAATAPAVTVAPPAAKFSLTAEDLVSDHEGKKSAAAATGSLNAGAGKPLGR